MAPNRAFLHHPANGSSDSFRQFAQGNESLFLVFRGYEGREYADFIVRHVDGKELTRTRISIAGSEWSSLSSDGNKICLADVTAEKTTIQFIDVKSSHVSNKFPISLIGELSAIECLRDGVALGTMDGVVQIIAADGNSVATHFSFAEGEWMTMTPEGYFYSSDESVAARIWGISTTGSRFPFAALSERFFRPDIVQAALSRKDLGQNAMKSLASLGPAPSVENHSSCSTRTRGQLGAISVLSLVRQFRSKIASINDYVITANHAG